MQRSIGIVLALAACMLVASSANKPAVAKDTENKIGWNVDCEYQNTAKVDPIVSPGRPSAHLHDFIGAQVTENSTNRSLRAEAHGPSNCGYPADKSGYWLPTLYKNGNRVPIADGKAYYRLAPGAPARQVRPYVRDTKIIAGDHTSGGSQTGVVSWTCNGNKGDASPYDQAPDCTLGRRSGQVVVQIVFPDCQDSRADSSDHRGHMTYSRNGVCPLSHPRYVPLLKLHVVYDLQDGSNARLSHRRNDSFGMHADFMEAWRGGRLNELIERCIHTRTVCGTVGNAN